MAGGFRVESNGFGNSHRAGLNRLPRIASEVVIFATAFLNSTPV